MDDTQQDLSAWAPVTFWADKALLWGCPEYRGRFSSTSGLCH